MTAHLFNQREQRALFVGLDLETTSTDPSRAKIVQFASVAQCPGFLPPEGSVANFLLDPGCAILPSATAVHGITDEMVRGKLTFDQNLSQLMKLLHMATQPGAIVTGYNVRRYGWALLQHALAESGIILPTPTFVDVCDLIGWYCTACPLHVSRYDTVPGEGDSEARLAFIGEAPGKEEDATGRPFVGQAGKLLTEMIVAMGLTRQTVFITNTVRCRPPMNRKPERDELDACSGYLWATLQALPNLSHIVLLGATAAQSVLADPLLKITQERGKWRDLLIPSVADPHRVVNIMLTFHPSYLLRSPWEKPKAWVDLQMVVHALAAAAKGQTDAT